VIFLKIKNEKKQTEIIRNITSFDNICWLYEKDWKSEAKPSINRRL